MGKDGFFGSMEGFSQAAFTKLIDSFEVCKQMLPWMTKGKEYGEDKFAEKCLEEVGVLATEDYALIQDAVCVLGMHLDLPVVVSGLNCGVVNKRRGEFATRIPPRRAVLGWELPRGFLQGAWPLRGCAAGSALMEAAARKASGAA